MAGDFDPKRLARLQRAYGRLKAAQDTKAKADDLTQYADRPVDFAVEVLDEKRLWSKQIAMLESLRDNRKTTVRGAVGAGKGHVGAIAALWWMFAKRGFCIVTGATQDQVFRNFFDYELGKLWLPRKDRLGGELYRRALVPLGMPAKMIGDERLGIVGVVSKNISHMTGSHGSLVFGIVDEAQDVEDATFDALFNNAIGPEDRFLAIGNPAPPKVGADEFYQSHQDGSGWNRIVMPTLEHPNLIEQRMVIPGGPSQQWLDDMRRIKKEGSSWWRTYVLAQFPETAVDALFSLPDLQLAATNFTNDSFRGMYNGGRLVIAIDVAKGGGDCVAIAVLRGNICEQILYFETHGVIETEQIIVRTLRELNVKRSRTTQFTSDPLESGEVEATIVIDSAPTGGGPGIIAHLENDHGYDIVRFNGASTLGLPQEEGERYRNLRAFSYWALHVSVQNHQCAIPNDPELIEELRAITYFFNSADGVQITDKKEIIKQLKRSPDRADALMMAWSVERESVTLGGSSPTDNLGF